MTSLNRVHRTHPQEKRILTSGNAGGGVSYHRCPRCNKAYLYKKNLSRHLRFECGVQPSEQCFYCPYIARYKHSLHVHMRSQHGWNVEISPPLYE